jgi:hypothetical protein
MRTTSKLMIGGLAAVGLFLATPALAHDGHGHWKHDRYWRGHPVNERVVVREYVRTVPVYPQVVYPAYSAPAPGIHVVIPGIYIPFR